MRIQMTDSQKAELKELLSANSLRAAGFVKSEWAMARRMFRHAYRFCLERGIEKKPAGAVAEWQE